MRSYIVQWSQLIVRRILKMLPWFKKPQHSPLTLPNLPSFHHMKITHLPGEVKLFQREIQQLQQQLKSVLHGVLRNTITPEHTSLNPEERRILAEIDKERDRANRNNVTRTAAYVRFYLQFPEIHWALLAHMVSRNGGWNMTDLHGDLSGAFLTAQQRFNFYRLLERCNALIFYDAYPQLLLYAKSMEHQRSYFHLLPYFQVSPFMHPIWESFWSVSRLQREGVEEAGGAEAARTASSVLTVALIINEQNVIETNVLTISPYKEILHSLLFHLQEWLHFNYLLFPLNSEQQDRDMTPIWRPLVGRVVTQFAQLEERIETGRMLYALLFSNKELTDAISHFVQSQPHTGSRADYWHQVFTTSGAKRNHRPSRQGFPTLYSPTLEAVWEDTQHHFPTMRPWFQDLTAILQFQYSISVKDVDVTDEYYHHLLQMVTINPPKRK